MARNCIKYAKQQFQTSSQNCNKIEKYENKINSLIAFHIYFIITHKEKSEVLTAT